MEQAPSLLPPSPQPSLPLPMVGMVVTISPSFSLYRMVVFPAASRPTIKMRISFFPMRLFRRFPKILPMVPVAALSQWGLGRGNGNLVLPWSLEWRA